MAGGKCLDIAIVPGLPVPCDETIHVLSRAHEGVLSWRGVYADARPAISNNTVASAA
jgi:hypothetical protein